MLKLLSYQGISMIKSLKILFSLVALYAFIGFVVIPYFIQHNFTKLAKESLGTYAHIAKIYFNPFNLQFEIDDAVVYDKNNKVLLYFSKFSTNLELKYLLDSTLYINHLYLKNLFIDINIDKETHYNFEHIIHFLEGNSKDTNNSQEEASNKLYITIKKLDLLSTQLHFEDKSKSQTFVLKSKPFNLHVEDINTHENERGSLNIDIVTEQMGSIHSKAKLRLVPLQLEGSFNIDNFNINKMYSYIQDDVDFKLSGKQLDSSLNYSIFYTENQLDVELNNTLINVDTMHYEFNSTSIDFSQLDLAIDSIHYKEINSTTSTIINNFNTNLNGLIYRDSLNLLELSNFYTMFKRINIDTNSQIKAKVSDTKLTGFALKNRHKDLMAFDLLHIENLLIDTAHNSYNIKAITTNNTKSWVHLYKDLTTDFDYLVEKSDTKNDKNESKDKINLTIEDIYLNNSELSFFDLQKEPRRLAFKKINTHLHNISLDDNHTINFTNSISTPLSGEITNSGTLSISPFILDLNTTCEDVDLRAYLPYIKDYVNIDMITSSVDDSLQLHLDDKNPPHIDGDIHLKNIDIAHSLTKERILNVNAINLNALHFSDNHLLLEELMIDRAYSVLAIDEYKNSNFEGLLVSKESNTTQKKGKEEKPFSYLIANLIIKDAMLDYSDFSLPLKFKTHINELNGNVIALSSNKNDSTYVEVDGVVDKYGQATILGTLLPNNPEKELDVKVNFINIDITKLSPYSAKFIGQTIDEGKLWIDLNYNIVNGSLLSTNELKLKDFTLGKDIESNESVSLPISLAVALLKDSDGFIELSVPIDGNVSEPDFHYGGTLLSVFTNVITNIVTSPFNFLGKSLGINTNELSSISFKYAHSELQPPQREKLDKLIEVFSARPEIQLIIKASYDEIKDLEALKKEKFRNSALKNVKKNASLNSKYTLIQNMYIQTFGYEQFESMQKIFKESYPNQQEYNKEFFTLQLQQLIYLEKISDKELHTLALNRARAIKKHLIDNGLDSRRIIIDKTINVLKESDKKSCKVALSIDSKNKPN